MTTPNELTENPPSWHFQENLEISVPRTHELNTSSKDDFLIIDIREAHELEISSIQSAIHIPMGDIPSKINELDVDEDTTIAVLCRSGKRSLDVAMYLQQQGLDGARSVAGGINWWAQRIDPSLKQY
ncbi:MAG: rhodanese-like domain-containing protein [Phycisphaerales bacterium]|jgi:rhodanese-related sulfurtransferase|nr:rhodanese-like domain-containing protein [Phycisphaerales bacterium]